MTTDEQSEIRDELLIGTNQVSLIALSMKRSQDQQSQYSSNAYSKSNRQIKKPFHDDSPILIK